MRRIDLALPFRVLRALLVGGSLTASQLCAQTQFTELGRQDLPAQRTPPSCDLRYNTFAVALGDVDGDSDLDLVVADFSRTRLFLNDGKGKFTDVTATHMPKVSGGSLTMALGDVDGDRDLDLVVGDDLFITQKRLYLNDGKGRFTDATATHMPKDSDFTAGLALGDVDGDRDLDLVVTNYGLFAKQNRLYLNDGKGRFTDATATHMPKDSDTSAGLALGDVDGDRDLDLVVANVGSFVGEQNRLYLNDGKGKFTDVTASRLPKRNNTSWAVALGDVDGDRDLDLVFGNGTGTYGEQNRLYLNDGKGKFTDATATHMPKDSDGSFGLALGDVDGDRDLDLVVANVGSFVGGGEQNRLYLNDGKGKFTDATASRLPKASNYSQAAALGDVDGDRDLDLVVGNGFGSSLFCNFKNRLYLNLHRQVHAPLLARIGNPYALDFYATPGYATSYHLVIPFVATAEKKTKIPLFGTFGLDFARMVVLPLMWILPSNGRTTLSLEIPNDPGLIGTTLFAQGLIISDLVFPPLGWRFTNVTADKIIR